MCITKLLDLADGLFSVSGPRIRELLCTNPDSPLVAVKASARGASGANPSVTGRHSSARAIAGAILTDIQPRLAQECVSHCEIFGLSHPTAIAIATGLPRPEETTTGSVRQFWLIYSRSYLLRLEERAQIWGKTGRVLLHTTRKWPWQSIGQNDSCGVPGSTGSVRSSESCRCGVSGAAVT
jgi:hypothetical protein